MGNVSVSLSNRRFTAIALSGKVPTNVVYRDPTPNELKRLNEVSVLGDKLPSRSIAVTPSMKNSDVLFKVSLDDDSALAESEAMASAQAQAYAAAEEAEIEAEADAAEW